MCGKLLPCYSLTASFEFDSVDSVIKILTECGATVCTIINDNNKVNQYFFKLFPKSDPSKPWIAYSVHNPDQKRFLLYDTVHLFKNLRNNWETERTQTLNFFVDEDPVPVQARWQDLRDLYNHETYGHGAQARPTPLE